MEIKKRESFIRFKDCLGSNCKISIEWDRLKFIIHPNKFVPDYAAFSQEDIKALLPYLQAFAESGTLELPQESPLQGGSQFSETAQKILDIIVKHTSLETSYIAGWHICNYLGVGRWQLNCTIPETKYDEALKELINACVVEELPDLACRYRLTKKYRNAQLLGGNDERTE